RYSVGTRTLQIDQALPWVLINYVDFHGLLTVALPLWATARLRRVALNERFGAPKKEGKVRQWFGRPAVGKWPVLWKEVFVERGIRWHWLARIFVALLVALSFLPVGLIFYYVYFEMPSYGSAYSYFGGQAEIFGREMNVWVRFVGPMVA